MWVGKSGYLKLEGGKAGADREEGADQQSNETEEVKLCKRDSEH